jgi:hypothetical protein
MQLFTVKMSNFLVGSAGCTFVKYKKTVEKKNISRGPYDILNQGLLVRHCL